MIPVKTRATALWQHFMHDSMRRNSSLLIISQTVAAGCAFLFWVINAHLFSAETVGLATAFISFCMLAATFTNLGLPNTIIRFLPASKQRGGLFTASILLILVASFAGSLAAMFLASHIMPKLAFVHSSVELSILLILFVIGTAVSALVDGTLMAFRKGEYVLHKSLITNLPRVVLLFFVVTAGVKGIISVLVITLFAGICYNLFIIFRKLLVKERLRPTFNEVSKHRPYAVSNYFGGLFGVLPSTLVPILILGALGGAKAAYYYIPMMIAAFMSVICSSVSQSLIAECSQTDDNEKHKASLKKAFRHQYQMLVPAILIFLTLGWPILRIYGTEYATNGYIPLAILLVSSLIVGLNWLGDTWLNIKKQSKDYFLMNAFNSLVVVGFVYLFVSHGLVAAAFGWLCGQLLSAMVYIVIFTRGSDFIFCVSA